MSSLATAAGYVKRRRPVTGSPLRHLKGMVPRSALAGLVAGAVTLSLGACRSGSRSATQELQAPSVASATAELPATCVLFLAQATCWLRKSGNSPSEVDRAVGAARALFESRASVGPPDDTDTRCQRAMARLKDEFEATACEEVVAKLATLPPADPVTCPPNEHFFIRRDGRVSGCHPDCASSTDCPPGTSCTAIGTAPGGPIEEPYCE